MSRIALFIHTACLFNKNSINYQILEKQDAKIHTSNCYIKDYEEQIKYCKERIKWQKKRTAQLKKEKEDLLIEFNVDHKNIEKRLSEAYPEFT